MANQNLSFGKALDLITTPGKIVAPIEQKNNDGKYPWGLTNYDALGKPVLVMLSHGGVTPYGNFHADVTKEWVEITAKDIVKQA